MLLQSILKTSRLLKECRYSEVNINSHTGKIMLKHQNGNIFYLADIDNNDPVSSNDDNISTDDDANYCYGFDSNDDEETEIDDDNDDDADDIMDEDKDKEREEKKKKGKSRKKVEEKSEKKSEEESEKESEEESEKDDEDSITPFMIQMGHDLYQLLQNISKIPTPPPTYNNHNIEESQYRSLLVNYLFTINDKCDFNFNCNDIFLCVKPSSSRKSSISFILNEEEEEEEESAEESGNDEIMRDIFRNVLDVQEHQIDIKPGDPIIDKKVISGLKDHSSLFASNSLDEFENKKQVACAAISKIILRIYDSSLKDQVSNEIIRRRQFRHLIIFYDYYEKLEVYCNLHKDRKKGVTIKSQAIKTIVRLSKPSKEEPPKIKSSTISTILNKALRIRRLLEVASDNFNIIDAFPDLEPYLFSANKLSVVNFERWLGLVRTNQLISFKEGELLYKNFKAETKRKRKENLNKLYK